METLLDAAFRVFGARGYRATRLDSVAEEAGVTKGAIYYHFDNKEDLLRQAVHRRVHEMFAQIADSLSQQRGPASARIRFVLRKLWLHWVSPDSAGAFRLLVGELSVEFPDVFRMWATEGPIHGWSLVRDLVHEGIEAGEFRRDVDAEVAGRVIVSGLMLQAALQVQLGLGNVAPCDPDRIFDSSVDVFLHGLSVTHGLPSPAAGREG